VIGCDVGSQGLKAIVVDEEGNVRGSASQSYPLIYPRPTWAEQDVRGWLRALEEAVPKALAEAGVDGREVVAFGLDGYVDGFVPINEVGEPLRLCFLWFDRRAVAECQLVATRITKEELFRLTGLNLDASHVAAKMLWFKRNEPTLFERTYKMLMPASYLVYELTGELAIDWSNASSTMLLDVSEKRWSERLLHAFEIDAEFLPPLKDATDVAGGLKPEWAKKLGLTPGIPVVVGSGDEHAACVGSGVVVPGLVCDVGGTAEPVCGVVHRPEFDETGLVETHCHADPATWLLENPGFVSGANLRWFRDNFGSVEVQAATTLGLDAYDLLTLEASSVPAGSEGLIVLPCFMGAMTPEWNELARGTVYGLTMGHTRAHLIRAILEASAYGLRDITDRMAAIGMEIKELRLVSGQARSPLWRQIKANVTGLPVAVPAETESTALGAALFALVAAGIYRDLPEAAEHAVHIVERLEPDEKAHREYDRTYALYRELYDRLRPVFERGAELLGN